MLRQPAPAPPARAPRRHGRGPAALALALVAAYAAWLLFGFWNRLDFHIGDEVVYLEQGRRLLRGVWTATLPSWSPLLSTCYGLVDLALPLRVGLHPSDVLFPATVVGSAVALAWGLRPLLPDAAAVLMAISWSSAAILLPHRQPAPLPSCYAFAATLGFLAVGALARARFKTGCLLLLLAAVERPEYLLWVLTFVAALAWTAWRRGGPRRRAAAFAGIALAAAVAAAVSPAHRQRAWFAFGQHYSLGRAIAREPKVDVDAQLRVMGAFQQFDPAMAQSFPGAASVVDAVRVAPRLVLDHVVANGARLPAAALAFAFDRFGWNRLAAWLWRGAVGLALLLALVLARRQWLALVRAWPAEVVCLLLSTLGMAGAALLIWPHQKLLYPWAPLVGALVGSALAALGARLGPWGTRALWSVTAALAAAVLAGPRPFPAHARQLAVRDAVRAVHDHVPPGPAQVFAVQGEALPVFTRRRELTGAQPSLAAMGSAGGLRAELLAAPPEYLILHVDAAHGFQTAAADMLAFAIERDYRLVSFTPRCLLFRR